jgi:hypothetical protein
MTIRNKFSSNMLWQPFLARETTRLAVPQPRCSQLLVMVLAAWALAWGAPPNAVAQQEAPLSSALQEDTSLANAVSLEFQGEQFLCYPVDPHATPAAAGENDLSRVAAAGRDYVSPPRCGPRNCWAMCVTCLYDLCRASGGSVADCQAERELCKQTDCPRLEPCPHSDPFCDFN